MNPKHVLAKAALVVPAAALAVCSITSVASANPGPRPPSSHSVVGAHFRVSYPVRDTFWSCSGDRITNKGMGTFDDETCDVTGVTAAEVAQYPAGTYTSNPGSIFGTGPFFGYGYWGSDYDGTIASSWTASLSYDATGGADGTATLNIVASYG